METVFGHAFMGTYQPTQPANTAKTTVQLVAQKTELTAEEEVNHTLTRFWEMEEPPLQQPALTKEEKMVTDHYALTHTFLSDAGKYQVALPKKQGDLKLGDSRAHAMLRYKANERAALRKGTWKKFREVVQEYLDLEHARLMTNDELQLPSSEAYYLPMHGVYKESSSTTKLRVVFDASSQSSSNVSLNDTLAVGPMLHPTLDHILLRFGTYRVALSGDISKMFREIHLSPPDQQLHRFLWRPKVDQAVQDYCMSRVTFGVASSPYLAVQTLQQAATDFGQDYPVAQWYINNSFYVDDLLGVADTVADTLSLYTQISEILTKGGFTLRKYRSKF